MKLLKQIRDFFLVVRELRKSISDVRQNFQFAIDHQNGKMNTHETALKLRISELEREISQAKELVNKLNEDHKKLLDTAQYSDVYIKSFRDKQTGETVRQFIRESRS